jgi:S-adenosylmethionine hydrolase
VDENVPLSIAYKKFVPVDLFAAINIHTSLDKFGKVWTSLNKSRTYKKFVPVDLFAAINIKIFTTLFWTNSRHVWTSLCKFLRDWKSLDKFGQVWTSLNKSEQIQNLQKVRSS